jgi:3-phosphoshikimate 1-carboxyvinyltransferase
MDDQVALHASRPLRGTARVSSDKAISHRAAILGALAHGRSVLWNFSPAGDCRSTLVVLTALGVPIVEADGALEVHGGGTERLAPPAAPLDCGRSATTMRLMAGAVAGTRFGVRLTGDRQLLTRPMDRIVEPLRRMGASLRWEIGRDLEIRGGALNGIEHHPEVPSAQVKSCLLLAGLHAEGRTTIVEPVPTRDHTERLIRAMGLPVERETSSSGVAVSVRAGSLHPIEVHVPGDPSSAAALAAGAAIVPGSDVVIAGIDLNPTRTGFFRALERMGAEVEFEVVREEPEPVGSVRVRHRPLHAISVTAPQVPAMIDELPLLALLATQAEGATEVRGAAELRRKETDRISGVVDGLRALGAELEELADGFVVRGSTPLRPGQCDAHRDHRLAMTFSLAGLITSGSVLVRGMEYVDDSFPGFAAALEALR